MPRLLSVSTAFNVLLAFVMSLMMSTQAFAHTGHDHSADSAMLMHLLFYGSLMVPIVLGLWFGYRYLKQHNARR